MIDKKFIGFFIYGGALVLGLALQTPVNTQAERRGTSQKTTSQTRTTAARSSSNHNSPNKEDARHSSKKVKSQRDSPVEAQ